MLVKRSDLAWTLNEIAKDGREAFYSGSISEKIVKAMQQNNGYITAKDLNNYQPRFSQPIQTSYRDHTVLAHPPPAGGAAVLLEGLNIIENFETNKMGPNSASFIHLFAEALQRGHMDRSRFSSILVDEIELTAAMTAATPRAMPIATQTRTTPTPTRQAQSQPLPSKRRALRFPRGPSAHPARPGSTPRRHSAARCGRASTES
mgnify:CR=1 FL=1